MAAEIRGMPELLRKLNQPKWAAVPGGRFLDAWTKTALTEVRQNVHASFFWHGDVEGSFRADRDRSFFPTWATVGSDDPVARFGEYGTGELSEDPESSHRAYFPNVLALTPWAEEKGISPFLVARAIFRKGGTEPRHFLRDAVEEANRQMPRLLSRFAGEIETEAARS